MALALAALSAAPSVGAGQEARQEAGQDMRLATGAAATFQLPETPSTGYSWRIDRTASKGLDRLEITDQGHRRGADMPGAPGTRLWRIRALRPGTAAIVFAYQRPWEPAPVATRHLRVRVGG